MDSTDVVVIVVVSLTIVVDHNERHPRRTTSFEMRRNSSFHVHLLFFLQHPLLTSSCDDATNENNRPKRTFFHSVFTTFTTRNCDNFHRCRGRRRKCMFNYRRLIHVIETVRCIKKIWPNVKSFFQKCKIRESLADRFRWRNSIKVVMQNVCVSHHSNLSARAVLLGGCMQGSSPSDGGSLPHVGEF